MHSGYAFKELTVNFVLSCCLLIKYVTESSPRQMDAFGRSVLAGRPERISEMQDMDIGVSEPRQRHENGQK